MIYEIYDVASRSAVLALHPAASHQLRLL